jgi:hypothetical protein
MKYTTEQLERIRRNLGIPKPKRAEDLPIYLYKSFGWDEDNFVAEGEAGIVEEANISDLVTRCIYKFGVGTYISKIHPGLAKLGSDEYEKRLTDEEWSDFYMELCNSEDIDKQKTLITAHDGESFKITTLVLEDWRAYKLK